MASRKFIIFLKCFVVIVFKDLMFLHLTLPSIKAEYERADYDEIIDSFDAPDNIGYKDNAVEAGQFMDTAAKKFKNKMRGKRLKWRFLPVNSQPEDVQYNSYEDIDWVAGFRNNRENMERAENIKREIESQNYAEDYDNWKDEYDDYDVLNDDEDNNKDNQDRKTKELFFKRKLTCSEANRGGVWFKSMYCTIKDFAEGNITREDFKGYLKRLFKFWLIVYLIIACPCWCKRGWCCCCCRCRLCRPRIVIDDAKKYMMLNPPGTMIVDNQTITYKPTDIEIYAYKNLEYSLRNI